MLNGLIMQMFFISLLLNQFFVTPAICQETLSKKQIAIIAGARSCIGDVYDASYYASGPPPRGRGACVDVLYWAYLEMGVDMQEEIDKDIWNDYSAYPFVRNRNIDYRWCPNLYVWFKKYTTQLSIKIDNKNLNQWKAGDVIFWSIEGDGVADHVGIVSEQKNEFGRPYVIQNCSPVCDEGDYLNLWMRVGHFRY